MLDCSYSCKPLLPEETKRLREQLINSGEENTTSLRSEFKFFTSADEADDIIAHLENVFPAKYDRKGSQISGIGSRDNFIKLKLDREKLDACVFIGHDWENQTRTLLFTAIDKQGN